MRGRRIDHPHLGVGDQRDGLAGGVVRQAQDHDVGAVERVGPSRGILAARIVQDDQFELAARRKALADFEPRRTGRAVDEDLGDHGVAAVPPFP